MKIHVGFSRPNTWKPFAWLIMKAYNTPYDHVFIRIHSDKYSRDLIYQASGSMVNFMGPDLFAAHNVIVAEFEVDVPDENYIAMMQFAIDNAGKPYGIKMVFGLGLVRLCELFGKTIKNPFSDGGATYVCCELAGFIMSQYAGAHIGKDQDDWTPKYIYDYLVLNNNPI